MGGFVSGPVLRITIDQAGFEEAAKQAFAGVSAQIQSANKQSAARIAQQIAEPLQAQAVKLRALYSTGALGLQAVQVQQKALVSSIDAEIAKLVTRNDLTVKQLSTLKQMTLERERQQNALNRGVGVGVTAGTASALQQGTQGIIANISKLGTSLLGLSGASGAETQIFTGVASGIESIGAKAGTAALIVGGFTIALGAAGLAAIALGKAGTDVVLNLVNISHQTGVSVRDLQVLQAEGDSVGIGLDAMVVGFRKFSQAVTGETGGEGAGFEGAGKKAVALLQALGVTSKEPITALEQTYNALSKLPDGFDKDAAAIELFGRSGLRLIPIIDQGGQGFVKFKKIVDEFGPSITENLVKTTNDARDAQVKLNQDIQKLEIGLIPVIGKILEYGASLKSSFDFVKQGLGDRVREIGGVFSAFAQVDPFAAGAQSIAGLPGAASSATAQLDKLAKGFSAGDAAAKKMAASVHGVVSGANEEAIKNAIEAAKLYEEILTKASDKLAEINTQSLTRGLAPEDKVLAEEQQRLEAIADIMLNFPSLAGQASTAAKNVVTATINELTLLADKSLKEIQTKNDESNKVEETKARELANLLAGVEGDLAVDRAKIAQNAVQAIIAEEQKRLNDSIAKAAALGATEQDLQKLRVLYNQDANAKIADFQAQQIKKTQDALKAEAGKIFDTLISDPKNLGTKLKEELISLVASPVKSVFENVFASLLTPFVSKIKGSIVTVGQGLASQGGILGTIGTALVGVGGGTNPGVDATRLNTTSTDANTVALNSLTGTLSGTTAAGSGFALSATGGFSGIDNSALGVALGSNESSSRNSNPIGIGNTPDASKLGNIGALANLGLGAIGLIANLTSKNASASQIIGNTAATLGGGLTTIGQLTKNSTLGTVGTAIGGAGQVIGGIASSVKSGGIGGALQAGIGGAELGSLILPGIGTAIGAAVGFAAGLIGDLFHHGVSQAAIDRAVKRQSLSQGQLNALQGVTYDNAVGANFSDTARTGFSEGPGGVFSTFGATNTQQPYPIVLHYNPVIQAFDQTGVNAVLAQHGTQIAQKIGALSAATNSGLGRNIRAAVNPA